MFEIILWLLILSFILEFIDSTLGGGYGPVAVSGQLLNNIETKSAIAITSISEAIICIVGMIGYTIFIGISDISLLISLCIGAILATPLSALSVSKLTMNRLKSIIGITVILIGIVTLFKVLFL